MRSLKVTVEVEEMTPKAAATEALRIAQSLPWMIPVQVICSEGESVWRSWKIELTLKAIIMIDGGYGDARNEPGYGISLEEHLRTMLESE